MINKIRTIFAALILGIMVIIFLPILLVCCIVRIFNSYAAGRIAQFLLRILFKVIIFISGARIDVNGLENIPDCPVLYTANHRGVFDIVTAYSIIKKPLSFVAKIQLQKVPVLHGWMKLMHGLFIDRDDVRQGLKTILAAALNITKGISVWIFPEGKRKMNCPETEMYPFKQGSFKIAAKSECPIIPVAMYGIRNVFDEGEFILRPGHIVVSFLPAVHLDELEEEKRRHIADYVQGMMHDELARIIENEKETS